MLEFWVALLLFLGSHSLVSRTGLRTVLVRALGERGYLVVYSLFSLVLLGWLILAAQDAPRTQLWPWAHSLYWFPNILMPLACILLVGGFLVPNPLSIAPKDKAYNLGRPPFIVALTRHPVMWGFFLWAFSHLIPNGEYPLALMFFIFAVFAILGLWILDRKRKRELGAENWHMLARNTHPVFLCSSALWRGKISITRKDIISIIGGVFLYGFLYSLHAYFFGVSPQPPL